MKQRYTIIAAIFFFGVVSMASAHENSRMLEDSDWEWYELWEWPILKQNWYFIVLSIVLVPIINLLLWWLFSGEDCKKLQFSAAQQHHVVAFQENAQQHRLQHKKTLTINDYKQPMCSDSDIQMVQQFKK